MADTTEAADAPEEAEEGQEETTKKSPIKLIGIMAGALVVLTAGSFFAINKLFPPPDATAEEAEVVEEEVPRAKCEISNIILNPADKGATRYVKVSVVFETKGEKVVDAITERDYRAKDLIIGLMGRRTAVELASAEVRDQIRIQIKDELNSTLADGGILDVFFTEFVIQ